MEKLKELRVRFRSEKKVRHIVYLLSFVMTIVFMNMFHRNVVWMGDAALYRTYALTAIPTSILLYIADGFRGYKSIIIVISRIAGAITGIFAAMTAFMMGLGTLFALGMKILVTVVAAVACIAVIYALPVIFIPILGFLAGRADAAETLATEETDTVKTRTAERLNAAETCTAEQKSATFSEREAIGFEQLADSGQEEVNWERIYAGVKAHMMEN